MPPGFQNNPKVKGYWSTGIKRDSDINVNREVANHGEFSGRNETVTLDKERVGWERFQLK